MAKFIDLTGQRFGKLTAQKYFGKEMWECKCDCGEVFAARGRALRNGKTTSCGCDKDLTGQIFGEWTVVSRAKQGIKYWNCVCSCGTKRVVVGSDLRAGRTKSCGCHKVVKLAGQRFGKLIAREHIGNGMWLCDCDCGNQTVVNTLNLRKGNIKSCGCGRYEKREAYYSKHGKSRTRLYGVWSGMKKRCYNKNSESYSTYGEKGIAICDEWLGDNGFQNFYYWAMANGYDESASKFVCTIDRIDNNKGYSPDNCRFVNGKAQANNRSTNHLVEYKGRKLPITQLAEEMGLKPNLVWWRITHGWSVENAVEMPKLKKSQTRRNLQCRQGTQERGKPTQKN